MTKRSESTDFEQPQDLIADPPMTLAEGAPQQFPPLYGNENYVSDHRQGKSVPPPVVTGAEWLVDAKEIETVLYRGDAVSYETLERLFLQSVPVIEAAGSGSGDTRSKKEKRADAEDEKREKREG